jgi:predicted ATPase
LFVVGARADWFRRTASRLLEMQSEDYLRLKPGAPENAPAAMHEPEPA